MALHSLCSSANDCGSIAVRFGIAGLLYTFSLLAPTLHAQEAELPAQPQTLPAEVATRFDQLQSEILAETEEARQIDAVLPETEGIFVEILTARRDQTSTARFRNTMELAKAVIEHREQGYDVAAYEAAVTADLVELPEAIEGTLQRYRARTSFPDPALEPSEFVYQDQKLFALMRDLDDVIQVLLDYIEIAPEFGLDPSPQQDFLRLQMSEGAKNRSVFLELALQDAEALRQSVAALPDNTDLAEHYSAITARVTNTAELMQRSIDMMNELGLETRQYRRQVLAVTGEITTDVLDVGILSNLAKDWSNTALEIAGTEGPKWVLRLLLMILIIFVSAQIAKVAKKLVVQALNAGSVHFSYLLKEMVTAAVGNLILLLGILIALSQLGISLGPLLAGLGIAGFIVGFALQDSLSNFASGMLILLYRPFDVGDVVESGSVMGRVSAMSLVNTTFMTFDNQKMVVPNNMIWQSVITNLTAQRNRRIDMVIGVSYDDDVDQVQRILEDILGNCDAVLDDPEPMVRVHEFGDSSVNFIVRPWVKTADYWETHWTLNKAIKQRFDAEGITIPFPQRDIHVQGQLQDEEQDEKQDVEATAGKATGDA